MKWAGQGWQRTAQGSSLPGGGAQFHGECAWGQQADDPGSSLPGGGVLGYAGARVGTWECEHMQIRTRWLVVVLAFVAALLSPLITLFSQPSLCSARAAQPPTAPPLPEAESAPLLGDIPNRGEGERVIEFAGREWIVKAGDNLPPRANAWSGDEQSVRVDADGRLHLRIRQIGGVWHSAQVIARAPSNYGMVRFLVETPLDDPHPNVVLGMFLYRDDAREIDIEFSRRLAGGDFTALFAVQPSQQPGHRHAFRFDWAGASAHEMHWQPGWVCFRSLQGHAADAPAAVEWLFEGTSVPRAEDALRLQINLWLLDPAQQDAEVEAVITTVQG